MPELLRAVRTAAAVPVQSVKDAASTDFVVLPTRVLRSAARALVPVKVIVPEPFNNEDDAAARLEAESARL